MSHSLNSTLGFAPAAKTGPSWGKILNAIKVFFEALENGRNAKHAYARLTARGVNPAVASEEIFARYFAKK